MSSQIVIVSLVILAALPCSSARGGALGFRAGRRVKSGLNSCP
ncbi:MAG: hypothetical protein U9N45_05375 [Gemmatimonadota bacterium]|nr:hypothetical protein [Gemmatimonadota bacterium]